MKLGQSIKKIIKIDDEKFQISLLFADGVKKNINLGFLFEDSKKKPLIQEIKRGQIFKKAFIEGGALAWPNGFELCPDALRIWADKQSNDKAA